MHGPGPAAARPGPLAAPGRATGDPAGPVRAASPGTTVRVVDPTAVDLAADDAAFSLRAAVYRATPAVAADRTLALDVDFETGIGCSRPEPVGDAPRASACDRRWPGRPRRRLRARWSVAKTAAGRPLRAGGSCSPPTHHASCPATSGSSTTGWSSAASTASTTLVTLLRAAASASGGRLLDRLRLPWLLGRRGRHRHRRLPARDLPDRRRPATSGSSSCGTRRARSRPSATAGSASPAAPIRSRASTRTTRARDRQLRPRRAVLRGGVRHPGGAGRPDRDPADGPLLRRRCARPPGSPAARRRSRRPTAGSPSCSPRRSAARRSGTASYRPRPARLRGAPRAVRREGRGRHHPDAPVRDRTARDPEPRSPTGCSMVRRPASTSTTCCSRSTC